MFMKEGTYGAIVGIDTFALFLVKDSLMITGSNIQDTADQLPTYCDLVETFEKVNTPLNAALRDWDMYVVEDRMVDSQRTLLQLELTRRD